jgi:hypothetical protein
MKLVNLTPHTISIISSEGGSSVAVAPSGSVARCATKSVPAGVLHGGVALSRVEYGAVEGLPEPTPGTVFVVSALVRAAVPHRQDVASPGDLVRGADGQPVGCRGLVIN